MRIEIPQDTERFGAVLIYGVQNVLELDSSLKSKKTGPPESDVIHRISYEEMHDIARQMAIVVPMYGERIKLVEGVLCGIPNHCLVIVASNSPRHPVDRFALEREAFERFSRFAMIRIAWHSKPKIIEDSLFFAKWGRTSRNTNRFLNTLLSEYTGFETEIIKTGNAGEHALTMDLAMQLRYSSGYSIEPYHYINLFEQFGGLQGTTLRKELIREHVEIFQIASRNPHMHDTDKGDEHITEMTHAAMQVIYHSPICPKKLKKALLQEMRDLNMLKKKEKPADVRYYPALWHVDLQKFALALAKRPYAQHFLSLEVGDLPTLKPMLPETAVSSTAENP
jgi:hypothetical protein